MWKRKRAELSSAALVAKKAAARSENPDLRQRFRLKKNRPCGRFEEGVEGLVASIGFDDRQR
ncbi:hypothetical protein, partial [Bordetella avium]